MCKLIRAKSDVIALVLRAQYVNEVIEKLATQIQAGQVVSLVPRKEEGPQAP